MNDPVQPNETVPTGERPTRLADGRSVSTEELGHIVYEDLRRIADRLFQREKPGITLQPTAIVHEAYMALAGKDKQTWENRAHFLAVAATTMRRLLTDAARSRGRQKRGGGWERVTLASLEQDNVRDADLLDLEEALVKLEAVKARYARIVELRFFAGLSLEETARVLDLSTRMVQLEWAKAQAWLELHLGSGSS